MTKPFTIDSQPGIQRDGTLFDAKRHLGGQWVRWRLGRPRKMGGFRSIANNLFTQPRRIHCWFNGNQVFAHVGSNAGIQQVIFDTFGNLLAVNDRTPSGYIGGPFTGVTFDALFDTTTNLVQLVGHAAPNNGAIASSLRTIPFLGQIDGATPLAPFSDPGTLSLGGTWTQPSISGGVVCVQPFVFDYDSNGLVQWSAANLPLYLGVVGGTSGAGQARISSQKIVAGLPLRGGGAQSPAAVFWSLSEVITASFVGPPTYFAFNTVSPSSSILSYASVIEYDGLYFWPGVDRFMVFNGTVAELPNTQSQDWFFDNLTPGYEDQTWAMKVPRYGEIWWGACMFGSTVPNWFLIFNLRENCWYDTPMPTDSWLAGVYPSGFHRPLTAGLDRGEYKLWLTETGTDNVDGNDVQALRSFYETAIFGGPKNDPPDDRGMSLQQLEPDFVQTGDMIVRLVGQPNMRATPTDGPDVPLKQTPDVNERFPSFVPNKSQRLTRLHVESNVAGGSYTAGRLIMHGVPSESTSKF